jgi:hypothetical protein
MNRMALSGEEHTSTLFRARKTHAESWTGLCVSFGLYALCRRNHLERSAMVSNFGVNPKVHVTNSTGSSR